MGNLAKEQDRILERIARSGVQGDKGPLLNKKRDEAYWLNKPGAPKAKLANEKPRGETIDMISLFRPGKKDG